MLRRECQNSTSIELQKLTSGPNYSDADRILGRVSLLQAQSVADACYDAKTSDKPSDFSKPSGDEYELRESFIAPYTRTRNSTSETTTLLSVILLGAAVVCFWRAAGH